MEVNPREPREIKYVEQQASQRWWEKVHLHRPQLDGLTFICLLLIGIHAWVEYSGGVAQHKSLYTEQLGLSWRGIMAGKVWQLVTYSLLHGSWIHVLTNVFMIWVLGGRLIVIVGEKRMIQTLLLGVLGGGVMFAIFGIINVPSRFVVGISGGAFALFVLMAMLAPDVKMKPVPVTARNMARGFLIASLLLCLMNPDVGIYGLKSAGLWLGRLQLSQVFRIAHSCHLGGGLVGLWISIRVMGKLVTLEQLREARAASERGVK